MIRTILVAVAVFFLSVPAFPAQAAKAWKLDIEDCYGCHKRIQDFHAGGKHTKVPCTACHEKLREHVDGEVPRPVTRTDHAACGACHPDQLVSFMDPNLSSKAKVEKSTYKSRSPQFDRLLMPHGFTKEHDEPRAHAFGLVDHLIVDRAFGGRFQLKDWTAVAEAKKAGSDPWSLLTDAEPGSSDQKTFLPQTATAANPVCLSCKTQDHILRWRYLGDPGPGADWDRTSKVVEFVRTLRNPVNCFMCHDPHSARPRVVRDALIEAVVDRDLGAFPHDGKKSDLFPVTKVVFRNFRAIGLLGKPNSNLQCAQCHVEYNCNPGYDPGTGDRVGLSDRRTNLMPWASVLDIKARYDALGFADFKHSVTGAYLNKMQHPETETFWGSQHERKGVECKDCHMPRVKNAKGKEFTWHGMKSVRYSRPYSCTAKCHNGWTDEEAAYRIDAIQDYTRGKINKAEFWLGRLIDAYVRAKDKGAPEETLAEARDLHSQAHVLWEWWTAENSDGFHNPTLARESLTRSITLSQEAIQLLEKQ